MSFAKLTIVGNLGRDPELRYTPQGNAVCDFTLAVNTKDSSGEKTDWYKATAWGKTAENASRYLVKGCSVYIEGRPKTEEWKDRDGKTRFTNCVTVTEMQFLGGGRDVTGDDSDIGKPHENNSVGSDYDENLGF